METYEKLMSSALIAAADALKNGDVPVGAIVLDPVGNVIGTGANRREIDNDPSAHAEVVAMREAGRKLNNWRLDGCTVVVTLEPCAMCAGAIAQARIQRVVFGAWDEKAGAVGSQWDLLRDPRQLHKPEVIAGVMADECAALLADFFQDKR